MKSKPVLCVVAICLPMFASAADVALTWEGKVPGQPFEALQTQVNQLKQDVVVESNARLAGDVEIQGVLTSEMQARLQGDQQLEAKIAEESAARAAAVAALQGAQSSTANAISSETTARSEALSALAVAIGSEGSARAQLSSTVTGIANRISDIDASITDVANDVSSMSSSIQTKLERLLGAVRTLVYLDESGRKIRVGRADLQRLSGAIGFTDSAQCLIAKQLGRFPDQAFTEGAIANVETIATLLREVSSAIELQGNEVLAEVTANVATARESLPMVGADPCAGLVHRDPWDPQPPPSIPNSYTTAVRAIGGALGQALDSLANLRDAPNSKPMLPAL